MKDDPGPVCETDIWVCKRGECPCWMRKAMTLAELPRCPICGSEMEDAVRLLPPISDRERR